MATRHTCGGPVFGRLTAGCMRCDELIGGADPVRWNGPTQREKDEAYIILLARLKAHNCQLEICGPVGTAFDN